MIGLLTARFKWFVLNSTSLSLPPLKNLYDFIPHRVRVGVNLVLNLAKFDFNYANSDDRFQSSIYFV